jgi:hypothetical protein
MPPNTAANWGLSPRWPAVTRIDSGRWPPSTARCSFVVSPPRERPSAWSWGLLSTPPGSSRCRAPLCGPGSVLVRPGHRGIHADLPGDQALGVGLGLQGGENPPPGAVALPAPEQPVHRLPGPVAGGHVPPRRAGAGPPADPVDELAFAPGRWPARLLAGGQQRLQPGPLLVGQVSSSHTGSISRDPPTFETRPSTAAALGC